MTLLLSLFLFKFIILFSFNLPLIIITLLSLSFDLLFNNLFSFPLLLLIFKILFSLSFSLHLLLTLIKGCFLIWIFSSCFLLLELELFVNFIILFFVCNKFFGECKLLFLFIFNCILLLFILIIFWFEPLIFPWIKLFSVFSFIFTSLIFCSKLLISFLLLFLELELSKLNLSSRILYKSGELESVIISLFFLFVAVFSTASKTSKAWTKLSLISSLSLLKVYPA